MTDEEEKLLWGWATGGAIANLQDVRRSIVSALDEVRRLRGEAPPRIEVERSGEEAAVTWTAEGEGEGEGEGGNSAYWEGVAEARLEEIDRLYDRVSDLTNRLELALKGPVNSPL